MMRRQSNHFLSGFIVIGYFVFAPCASPEVLTQDFHYQTIQPDWVALDFVELAQRGPTEIITHLRQGEYDLARIKLTDAARLAPDRDTLHFFLNEAERIRRIQRDYSLDVAGLKRALDLRVRDWTEAEFNQWVSEGRFDVRVLNGEPRFFGASASNLYFRFPELRSRWLRSDYREFGQARLKTARYAMADTQIANPTQAARRFHIRMMVTVEDGAVKPGETVRCWLPFPKENHFQQDVKLLSTNLEPHVSPNNAPHRSVYMEQVVNENKPVKFIIEYTYTALPRYDPIDPTIITSYLPSDTTPFLQETHPHIRFHQEFIKLADQIVGDEKNPYWISYKLYDWLAEYADYSYAREYSTLEDIPMYVYRNQYGDCGQLALLYITLCRIKGVPARWESGWMIYPEGKNLHDWTTIYLSPYGWVPVDPNFGLDARKNWVGLNQDERDQLFQFYFGRLSPYRLVANDDVGRPHIPAKMFPRSDTVDFQRGELETQNENLYFDQFDYSLQILSDEPVE